MQEQEPVRQWVGRCHMTFHIASFNLNGRWQGFCLYHYKKPILCLYDSCLVIQVFRVHSHTGHVNKLLSDEVWMRPCPSAKLKPLTKLLSFEWRNNDMSTGCEQISRRRIIRPAATNNKSSECIAAALMIHKDDVWRSEEPWQTQLSHLLPTPLGLTASKTLHTKHQQLGAQGPRPRAEGPITRTGDLRRWHEML